MEHRVALAMVLAGRMAGICELQFLLQKVRAAGKFELVRFY